MHRTLALLPALAALTLGGCNQYELFRVAGYQQESFSNKADILFVVDNSSSMTDEAEALALNFDTFITRLTDPTAGAATYDGLDDAVDNYIRYANARGTFINYQLAITTTDMGDGRGQLYGDKPILAKDDDDVGESFVANLLCEATCFGSDVPNDGAYQCGDPVDSLSQQYLDCVCGTDVWKDNCGGGTEEHLEAIFLAMCRAVEEPPAECYDLSDFTEADIGSNAGLLRDDAMLIPVIVTDEGDGSRRMATGDDVPDEYLDLFAQFERRMAFAVIGPNTEVCNSGGAVTWAVERFHYLIDETNGLWVDIAVEDAAGDCDVADFSDALEQLGDLMNSLLEMFPLQSIPDVKTIKVFIDGEAVPKASETADDAGAVKYGDGWSYSPADNAIEFHGSAVPDYNADVKIYYRPLDGMPRELPF